MGARVITYKLGLVMPEDDDLDVHLMAEVIVRVIGSILAGRAEASSSECPAVMCEVGATESVMNDMSFAEVKHELERIVEASKKAGNN